MIRPAALVPYADRIDVNTILFDERATAIKASPQRCFTGLLRRVIEVRDRHCQHESGCDVAADRCDVDHVHPHAQGGRTEQRNGKLGCHYHNASGRTAAAGSGASPPTAGPPGLSTEQFELDPTITDIPPCWACRHPPLRAS